MFSRVITLLLAFVLALSAAPLCSLAEELPTLAGFDEASSGHDWNNNRFFLAMEERTGQHFKYQQFTEAAEYTQWKAGLTTDSDLPSVLFKAALTDEDIEHLLVYYYVQAWDGKFPETYVGNEDFYALLAALAAKSAGSGGSSGGGSGTP